VIDQTSPDALSERFGAEKGFLGGASPGRSTAGPSPATRLPQEIVDKIITYLIHDTPSLLTCSLTSRPWYIAVVPHLHHTLTTLITPYDNPAKIVWPRPLRVASGFGFLPFVTRLFINTELGGKFSSTLFHHWTLREFSTLTNVQELSISRLDILSFMPETQRYFGQLSQTLRSLTLKAPVGTDRQILFFVGLFPNLEDLKLEYGVLSFWVDPGDQTLVSPFFPSLRGQLTVSGHGGDGLAKAMIDLFGRVRFRHMHLSNVGGVQLLLYSCADALETFQLHATELGGKFSLKGVWVSTNNFTDRHSLRDYDFSRNGSLRELEIPAGSLNRALTDRAPATTSSFLRTVLSTITSPVFSKVLIVYQSGNFYSPVSFEREAAWYRRQFDAFREMCKARDFQLVLQALDVDDHSARELERAVAAETARGGLPPGLSVTFPLGRPKDADAISAVGSRQTSPL
jgi:hypothetical protein